MDHPSSTTSHFPQKYEASYVFSDTISRLFLTLAELHNIEELNKKTQLPFLFTVKLTPLTFSYTVGEITSLEYSNKVIWRLDNKNVPTPIFYTFTLIANTLDNTTLLVFEILLGQPEKIELVKRQKIISGCKKVCVEMINNIEMYLQVNNDNIYDYGSNIIKAPMEVVWEYVTNLKFMNNEYIKDLVIDGNPDKVGTMLRWKFVKDPEGNVCKSKVSYVNKSPNKKKWKYKMVPIEGPFQMQEIDFVFINLDNNSTFFSVYHDFKEQVSAETMEIVSKKKKFLLNLIKQAIEKNNEN